MTVIALAWNEDTLSADLSGIAAAGGDLADLASAVIVSLFTDRLAEADDTLPADDGDRRGWWADALADIEGDRIGSRLWLLNREKQTPEVANRARDYSLEALDWLIDDGVAERIEVDAEFVRRGVLGLGITVHRPAADPAAFRFNYVWGGG